MKPTIAIPDHLPERLSIVFPIWMIEDTPPGGVYHDIDRCVREIAERGFNCIRCEDGAGLTHDAGGLRRQPVQINSPFPGFSRRIRQTDLTGDGGPCNLLERLFALFDAAEKYNVYVILSSWYYLHTYWYCGSEAVNDELFAIAPHERFQAFARFLDRIIVELKARGRAHRIAFAEVLNEADGLPFVGGYRDKDGDPLSERRAFRSDHEKAIAFLRERHPDILFAYDTYTPFTDAELFPRNAQVWNYHNYFMWELYYPLENGLMDRADPTDPAALAPAAPYWKKHPATIQDVINCRAGKRDVPKDWLRRMWFYYNLDPDKLPDLEPVFEQRLAADADHYRQRIAINVNQAVKFAAEHLPGAPLVMGEGGSFCATMDFLWEEHSDLYWDMLAENVRAHRDAGFWGTVIRTTLGPEDPAWDCRAADIRRINAMFQD